MACRKNLINYPTQEIVWRIYDTIGSRLGWAKKNGFSIRNTD